MTRSVLAAASIAPAPDGQSAAHDAFEGLRLKLSQVLRWEARLKERRKEKEEGETERDEGNRSEG